MSSWLDDLLGKTIMVDGTVLPDRKKLNFKPAASVTIVDNEQLGSTDVTIHTGSTSAVMSGSGSMTLNASDSGSTLVNTAPTLWTLPAASDGLVFEVINMVVGGTTIKAIGSDLIAFGAAVSSAGGTQVTIDLYASVRIRAVGTKWIAVGAVNGGWAAA